MQNSDTVVGEVKPFRTRFIHNSRVCPANIEVSLANRGKKHLRINNRNRTVKPRFSLLPLGQVEVMLAK